MMDIRAVPEDLFWSEYEKAFEKVEVLTEEEQDILRERIYALQDEIAAALGSRWKKGEDFEIGEDYNFCHHVCGGVYSGRAICSQYLMGIVQALATDPEPGIWTFHTAVETPWLDGQFFVCNGSVVYPKNGPNFTRLLKRRIVIW